MKDKIITVNDVLSTEDFEKLRNRIMDKEISINIHCAIM